MSDWTPAMLRTLSGSTIVFDAGQIPVKRTFESAGDATGFVLEAGFTFEFSAALNAVRNPAGQVVDLPDVAVPQRFVDHTNCALIIDGHRPHHIPALKAAQRPAEEWEPVEFLGADGQKVSLATPDEVLTVYHHAPDRLRQAVEVHREFRILRGAWEEGADGQKRRSCFMYSKEPIGPCIA